MAVLKINDIRKLNKGQTEQKKAEIEKAILELQGEGRKEKIKPLRKAIARLNTYLWELTVKSKVK